MTLHDPDSPDHHQRRSDFVRGVVQRNPSGQAFKRPQGPQIPKTIVQFWHDLRRIPDDVEECIASWAIWETRGFRHNLFDEHAAETFIARSLGARYSRAFERCYHPSMQADYFRLCYLLVEGGFYVDADDVCVGSDIAWLFADGRLKLQPLCYDRATGEMVQPSIFLSNNANDSSWIFYFNNNPLAARRGHPIIEGALSQATSLLEAASAEILPEIQSTTGPGNLSKSIFEFVRAGGDVECELAVLRDWNSIAVSRWPLSYREDSRNWRLSNQKRFSMPSD